MLKHCNFMRSQWFPSVFFLHNGHNILCSNELEDQINVYLSSKLSKTWKYHTNFQHCNFMRFQSWFPSIFLYNGYNMLCRNKLKAQINVYLSRKLPKTWKYCQNFNIVISWVLDGFLPFFGTMNIIYCVAIN